MEKLIFILLKMKLFDLAWAHMERLLRGESERERKKGKMEQRTRKKGTGNRSGRDVSE